MSDFDTTRTPPNTCPVCRYVHDAATATQGGVPQEGSLSVCMNCGCVSEYVADLAIRALAPDELAALPANVLQHLARVETLRQEAIGAKVGTLHRRESKP